MKTRMATLCNICIIFISLWILSACGSRTNIPVNTPEPATVPEPTEINDQSIPTQDNTPIPTDIPVTDVPEPTPLPKIEASNAFSLVPFNYDLSDSGGGWNEGRVNIAIANRTADVIWLPSVLDFDNSIIVETEEGVSYPAVFQQPANIMGKDVISTEFYIFPETVPLIFPDSHFSQGMGIPILPNIQIDPGAEVSKGRYSSYIYWRSESSTHPTRIVFEEYPQLNFDLPTEKGTSIHFPFISDTDNIEPVTALKNVIIPTSNNQIEASFSGNCFTRISQAPNSTTLFIYLEYRIKNIDISSAYTGEYYIDSLWGDKPGNLFGLMYDERGTYFLYGFDDGFIVEDQAGVPRAVGLPKIEITPGNTAIAAVRVAQYIDDGIFRNVYFALVWQDESINIISYSIFDVSTCPLWEGS